MEFTCKESKRLDAAMSEALELPRNQVEKLIKNVGVTVDGKLCTKCSLKLVEGNVVHYEFVEAPQSPSSYEVDFDVPILYEDDDLLVVNKPPFLTVHGAPSVKEATLVDWLQCKGINLSTISGEERHGIVHRIDKETSGALVIAKNNEAHLSLSSQLEDKSMGRYYLAIIDLPLKDDIVVELPIGRSVNNRLKMDVAKRDGRMAKSAFTKLLLSRDSKKELIAAKLFTGRTHQIRVHLQALCRHILGDSLYGFKSQNGTIPRVMLHAYILYLKHPKTGQLLQIHAPLWDDFDAYLTHHFSKDEVNEKITLDSIVNGFKLNDHWLRKDA
ncbi:RluA family pseudouridine synthase [Sulfurospirillum multivorans]|uniref:Pseudouridine synthase n=2 Tax=Sulfurospirillum multivorans TaxID=66821 RepID=A0AA86AJZ8_SULMK|nr:RluA family pseudouridine synthase [Sulfurospirillum multivorans]AHJ12111.1 RNA pseudouridine synthase [Sulfurospirillum multivorans DSM 12446]QEH05612.1 RNA pseudouridine synthase [Sulfurospirillum multivorans]